MNRSLFRMAVDFCSILPRAIGYPITQSAMRIWQLCDSDHEVAAILNDLEGYYDIDRPTLERDSPQLIEDFAEKQLLAAE